MRVPDAVLVERVGHHRVPDAVPPADTRRVADDDHLRLVSSTPDEHEATAEKSDRSCMTSASVGISISPRATAMPTSRRSGRRAACSPRPAASSASAPASASPRARYRRLRRHRRHRLQHPAPVRRLRAVHEDGCRSQPLVDPRVRPETNCLWSTKNTISTGSATITDPAATRLVSVKNWPRRLFRALVIGNLSRATPGPSPRRTRCRSRSPRGRRVPRGRGARGAR